MNSALLSILGPPPGSAAGQSGSTGPSSTVHGDAFGLVLSGQLTALAQSPKPVAPVAGSDVKATALAAKIASMLKAGATEAEVIARLAAHLATSVAHALGTPTADAQNQLQAAFAGALATPGHSAPTEASLAQRSAALAQRFLDVQAIATNLITATTGQQKRIAGKLLDAKKAEEIPAHVNATTLGGAPAGAALPVKPAPGADGAIVGANAASRAAASAAAANAAAASAAAANATAADTSAANGAPMTSMAVGSATPSATSPSSAAPIAVASGLAQSQSAFLFDSPAQLTLAGSAGDGRRVAFDSKALSGAGDTVLGRVLTRAAVAADARASAGSVQAPNAATAEQSATIEAQSAAAGADAQTPIAAFVASFAAAMGTASPTKAVADGEPSAIVSALTPTAADSAAPAFVPAVAPFAIERLAPPAMSTPAAPATPVDQSAIVDQVLRGAFMRNTGESSEMRLSLVPETLGDVNVKLVISGGNVSAHVLAQTPEVRDALIAAQPQLSKSLADSGLKLQSFNVDLSGDGFAGFTQQQGSQSQHGGARARQTALADDEFDDSTLDAIPSFGPSISTPTFAGDYNYLA